MKRKLYLVDYEENGQDKYKPMELTGVGCLTDSEIVQLIHFYIGRNNRLSSVAEFETDLSLHELDRACELPSVINIPHRVLYVDMEEMNEIRRIREKMLCK